MPPNHSSKPAPHGPPAGGKDAPRPESGPSAHDQLAQKDQLIHALTEQLEQAAEQLDRLQRAGADRHRSAGASLPGALVDEQRKTIKDLQRVVQQWEDLQAGLTLGRIEIQLSELRDLVAQGVFVHGSHAAGPVIHEEPTPLDPEPEEDGASRWAMMKAQLLAGDTPEATEAPTTDEASEPLAAPPATVDVESIGIEALREAVRVRDDYITYVVARLRRVEALQPAAELARLDPTGAPFAARVHELEQRLQEHLRASEVEFSVERAKLARERSQMAQHHEQLERQLKRLGITSLHEIEQVIAPQANAQERRWARFLGGKPKGE
jgi:hypothetical protein